MAKEAAKASDRVIITSDNPRFEEPQDIINDMLAGLDKDDMQKTISIADRREAIKTACMLAQPGDVILVAGKGHENYQEVKGVKHHFDDKEDVYKRQVICSNRGFETWRTIGSNHLPFTGRPDGKEYHENRKCGR